MCLYACACAVCMRLSLSVWVYSFVFYLIQSVLMWIFDSIQSLNISHIILFVFCIFYLQQFLSICIKTLICARIYFHINKLNDVHEL